METRWLDLESPLGTLTLVAGPRGIRALTWDRKQARSLKRGSRGSGRAEGEAERHLRDGQRWLVSYFRGADPGKPPLLDLAGSVRGEFSRRVLKTLARSRRGSTLSYGELAKRAGSPRAARAVGRAMASNPLPIFIPCHRVLSAGGGPGGFGGGLRRKQQLLALEGIELKLK